MRRACLIVVAMIVVGTAVGPVMAGASVVPDVAQDTECAFPATFTDATGTEVTVESEPQRIVTLAPSAAQTMWEIGGREKVVGVSQYATYLEGADTRTNISGAGQTFVNIEKVVNLTPDLVLAPSVIPPETVTALREAGVTVYKFSAATTIDEIKQKTERTGQLTGHCAGADDTVDWMESKLSVVDQAVAGQVRPRALYVFYGFTAGNGTFVHNMIRRAGGVNVAAQANISGFAPISEEVVVQSNPQWIVLNDGAPRVPQTPAYNNTTAVQEDQIVVLREEYVSQPAPRIVYSVVKLVKAFHPDAYARANVTTTTATTTAQTETTTSAAETSPAETTTAADSGPGVPGFGFGIAVVALVLSIAAVTRRR